jgi:N-methylhydantoinase A/oxoprolinase/acetone carboxylase beta subunit
VSQLIAVGLVVVGSFTPTDAVHVLGRYDRWSVEAARLGATLWARRLEVDAEQFSEAVVRQVEIQLGRVVISSALAEEAVPMPMARDGVGQLFIDRALRADGEGSFSVSVDMRRPLVAIGAPVGSYLPPVAERLNAGLFIPEHAEVRNALGAVVGGVVQRVRVLIQPLLAGSVYRAHLPGEVRVFPHLEEAVACAKDEAAEAVGELARRAGAIEAKVDVKREDQILRDRRGLADEIYLGTEVTATAVGRPRMRS